MNAEQRQEVRIGRLRQIAEEHTGEIHDAQAADQLAGIEPVTPFAAVTSEGSAESSFHSNGNLRVFGTRAEMETALAQEAVDGWVTHGRIWNLDAEWDPWGNLQLICSVEIRTARS